MMHAINTHLEGAFLSCFLAVTFQHFAVDSQTENLSCDLIVICHRVSPELQLTVGGWWVVGEATAQALRVTETPTDWIYRLLLLVLVHFGAGKTDSDTERFTSLFPKEQIRCHHNSLSAQDTSLIHNRISS